jgi:hypothetical protein
MGNSDLKTGCTMRREVKDKMQRGEESRANIHNKSQ